MSRHRTLSDARTGVPWRFRFEQTDEQIDGFGDRPPIQRAYAASTADRMRNDMILDHVLAALEAGRSPMVLAEHRDHAEYLADRLEGMPAISCCSGRARPAPAAVRLPNGSTPGRMWRNGR